MPRIPTDIAGFRKYLQKVQKQKKADIRRQVKLRKKREKALKRIREDYGLAAGFLFMREKP